MKLALIHTFSFFILGLFALPVRAGNIAVIMSSDAGIYHEVLNGFKEVARHRIASVQTLKATPAEWQQQLKTIRSVVEPDLVFVIGTAALQIASRDITNIPIVHALVFDPLGSIVAPGKNVSGISMTPSADQVISLLKELNKKLRVVGTIYEPSRGGHKFAQTRLTFQKNGLQLIGREIRSAIDIGAALKSFEKKIEFLWLWPDERLLVDDILKRIFLYSFENKIPVLGLSERHSQMGAMVSLAYGGAQEIGRHAGEIANQLSGESILSIGFQIPPRQTKLTVNFKTARELDFVIPDTIVSRADNVVKAPVYRNGDWWDFRIKIMEPSGVTQTEIHRVTFKNEKFESEDSSFLTGGDSTFLPWATVYFTDPAKKWLDFPLIPGKKWLFRYRQRTTHSWAQDPTSTTGIVTSNAEVIGQSPHPIETPAGKFEAIEIARVEHPGGFADLTYFYSPQTQSVVKLRAQVEGNYEGRYELELIAYGRGDSARRATPNPRLQK